MTPLTQNRLIAFGIALILFWAASLIGALIGGMHLDEQTIGRMGLVAASGAVLVSLLISGEHDNDPSH